MLTTKCKLSTGNTATLSILTLYNPQVYLIYLIKLKLNPTIISHTYLWPFVVKPSLRQNHKSLIKPPTITQIYLFSQKIMLTTSEPNSNPAPLPEAEAKFPY